MYGVLAYSLIITCHDNGHVQIVHNLLFVASAEEKNAAAFLQALSPI